MTDANAGEPGRQLVGHLTICMTRDAEGRITSDTYPDTIDPVGLTVGLIELVCVFSMHPSLLFHAGGVHNSREHQLEVIEQLSEGARDTLGTFFESSNLPPDSEANVG